jgi:hypothetical protein
MKTDFNFFRRHFYSELNCIVCVSCNWVLVTFKPRGGFGVLLRFTTPVQLCRANKYGPQALQIATTVKLARALWIIPVALITAYIL